MTDDGETVTIPKLVVVQTADGQQPADEAVPGVVPARVLADQPLALSISPKPGTLLPLAALGKALTAWAGLMDAINDEVGEPGLGWGVYEAAVAADGTVRVEILPIRVEPKPKRRRKR
jgi:hypothetical protein